jgi:uncharacterized protein
MKYLLLITIALVLWWAWKKRSDHPPAPKNSAAKVAEEIVACAHCGVLHPLSESLIEGDAHYCSAAHRLAGKSQPRP